MCDAAIFHAGPIIRPLENDKQFEMVSVDRLPVCAWKNLRKNLWKNWSKGNYWKGGMGPNTEYACKNYKGDSLCIPSRKCCGKAM